MNERTPVDTALEWLVARPVNGVFGLLALSALPLIGVFSSALLVMLVLRNGWRTAVIQAAIAAGLLGIASMLSGRNPGIVALSMALIWSPGLVLVAVLTAARSLTLSLQVSVIAVAGLVGIFFASVPDVTAYWQDVLASVAEAWREQGEGQMAEVVEQLLPYADQMTLTIALGLWVVHTGLFVLGYALYRRLPGESAGFGRFTDLNFGKVIAILMAVLSVAAMLVATLWVQSLAFLLFAVFWLQGLAVLHWMRSENKVPGVLLIFTYATLVILPISAIAIMLLALLGYADVWFNFRRSRAA